MTTTDSTTTPARAPGTVPALVGRNHPATLAKLYGGLIIQSALDGGWEAPAHYSPLKRARIARRLQLLAQSLHRQPNAEVHGRRSRTVQPLVGASGCPKES